MDSLLNILYFTQLGYLLYGKIKKVKLSGLQALILRKIFNAALVQLGERVFGMDEVSGSTPLGSATFLTKERKQLLFTIEQEATLEHEARLLGYKLADTLGVQHVHVNVDTECIGDLENGLFYTTTAQWFYDDCYCNCILSFKIENDEVVKVSLHLV